MSLHRFLKDQNKLREMTPQELSHYYFPPSEMSYWSGNSNIAKRVPPKYPVFENYSKGKYSTIPGGELTVEVEDEEMGVPGPEDLQEPYEYTHPYWWGPYYYNPKRWKYYKKPFLMYYYKPQVH